MGRAVICPEISVVSIMIQKLLKTLPLCSTLSREVNMQVRCEGQVGYPDHKFNESRHWVGIWPAIPGLALDIILQ